MPFLKQLCWHGSRMYRIHIRGTHWLPRTCQRVCHGRNQQKLPFLLLVSYLTSSSTAEVEVLHSSEMSLDIYQPAWHHNPEEDCALLAPIFCGFIYHYTVSAVERFGRCCCKKCVGSLFSQLIKYLFKSCRI